MRIRFLWQFFLILSAGALQVAAQAQAVLSFHDGSQLLSGSVRMDDRGSVWQDRKYLVLRFAATPTHEQRRQYEEAGVRFLHYIPDHAYLVSLPLGLDPTTVRTPLVLTHVVRLEANHKLSASFDTEEEVDGKIRVLFARDISIHEMEQILRQLSFTQAEIPFPGFQIAEVKATKEQIHTLSDHPAILWIEPAPGADEELRYPAVKNERVEALYADGIALHGSGVTIGMGDAGKVGTHIDLDAQVRNFSPFFVHVHATHVAGILTGRPNLNPAEGNGIAREAGIITAYFSQIILNTERFLQDEGMMITNNSYGSSLGSCTFAGDYSTNSIFIDAQLNTHDSLMHVFSSGNDGGMTCTPYPFRFHTVVTGFQSAKNTLVVGMLDHLDAINPGSSRGPVDDGRLKPEITAVGTNRRSTRPDNFYAGGSGTSYSSPAVAGICALMYEGYKQVHGNWPDATLIKALLLNTADDLGQPNPDFTYGYGRVHAHRAYKAMTDQTWYTEEADQGDVEEFVLQVPDNTAQLKVMLLWRDPPGAPYTAPALVNDLGLIVVDPMNEMFLPWVVTPTPTGCNQPAQRSVDDRNPQEQVTISNPTPGNYLLRVQGIDVPFGPQEFYVVYQIIPHELTVVYPNGSEALVPGTVEYIRWDASGNAAQTFTVEYSLNAGISWNVINNAVAPNLRRLTWTVPGSPGNEYLVRVTAGAFQDVSDTTFYSLGVPAGYVLTSPCRGYAQLSWSAVPGADHYAIYRLSDGWMQQVATTTGLQHTIGNLEPGIREWFSVSAVNVTGSAGRRAVAQSTVAEGSVICSWTDDIALEAFLDPIDGREHTIRALDATEAVTIAVRNLGMNTVSNIPVVFMLDNGQEHSAIIPGPLSPGAEISFSFPMTIDLSLSGTYQLAAWSAFAADTHRENDTIVTAIRNVPNPVITLPWHEGFEGDAEITLAEDAYAISGLEHTDFSVVAGKARMRTFAGSAFCAEGTRALTLDNVEYDSLASGEFDITLNLSAYDTATHDVRLTFTSMHHVLDAQGDTLNDILIRGSDQDPWIKVSDVFVNGTLPAVFVTSHGGILLSHALKNHGQNFSASFQIRFVQTGQASADFPEMEDGFTIDEIHVFEVMHDARLLACTYPLPVNCNLNEETISVLAENTSSVPMTNVTAAYQVDNGSIVSEVIPFIPPGDTVQYDFNTTFHFPGDSLVQLKTWIRYLPDNLFSNDSVTLEVRNFPTINTYPYLEDFESGDGGWRASGIQSTLELGTPSGSVISKAASGSYAWVTNLNGDYADYETSYLTSPCFDLSSIDQPVLSFSHIYDMEYGYDYHWVEYSTDGVTWVRLGSIEDGFHWYDHPEHAWTGEQETWQVASVTLPEDVDALQIRFVFTSDVGVTLEGFGVDDIHVHAMHPIYHGPDILNATIAVDGNEWEYLDSGGHRIIGIHPAGQDLGVTHISAYLQNPDTTARGQAWLLDRNWVINPEHAPAMPVRVRLFFTQDDFEEVLIEAENIGTNCGDCTGLEDAYSFEGWKFSGNTEDNTLENNLSGQTAYFGADEVLIVPFDSGYYAEITVHALSEIWLTGPRIHYRDTLVRIVSSSGDDAEEYIYTGSVNPISSVLDIAETPDSHVVGVRFRNIGIPGGSIIQSAFLQFTAAASDTSPALMAIRAEIPKSLTGYTTRHFHVSNRTYTVESQSWPIPSWNSGDQSYAQQSPDLRMLIQEIVDHPGWTPGSDIACTLTGSGLRRAWSIDGNPASATKLIINYDSVCHRSGIVYVDAEATGNATGESWQNACTSLQHALDLAERCPEAREIWVKEGEYLPAPFNSFVVASGIHLYGGFDGTELLLSERDPIAHQTILSGDLGVSGSSSDNSLHVLSLLSGNDTTRIDGFIIQDGNAQGVGVKGGGIYSQSHCILNQIVITGCQASGGGSAIAHHGTGNRMRISNAIMQDNTGIPLSNETGAIIHLDDGSVTIEE